MKYKTPAALEMAVKQAAKNSLQDTNRAISGFYFHRLLCRIFADENDSFVLKGGLSMLARTIDARTTRDIDLLSTRCDLKSALIELLTLAEKDLDDFIHFEYDGHESIKTDDKYRSGVTVKFIPYLGAKPMQTVSIDLVIDEIPLEGAERLTPVDRINIAGLAACGYLVYPVTAALSDKFCALHELHDARPSSRVKDLVDIAVYATECDIDADDLQNRLAREITVRKLGNIKSFTLPKEWGEAQAKQYGKLVAQTGLPTEYQDIVKAEKLARELFDPALAKINTNMHWNHEVKSWV